MNFSRNLQDNMTQLDSLLNVQTNFDVVYRVLRIGGREACLYFIDGFAKDDTLLKLLQTFPPSRRTICPRTRTAFQSSICLTGKSGWSATRTK